MQKLCLVAFLLCFLPLSIAKADLDMNKPIDLKFTALDGRQVDLAQMRGKVVLIDFWATWCAPCRAISPDIVDLYAKYHSQGLEIISVSADTDKSAVLNFVKKEGAAWPQYFDGKGADSELLDKFGIEQFPTIWLLDKKGVVVGTNFVDLWVNAQGLATARSDEATRKRIDAAIEKQLAMP